MSKKAFSAREREDTKWLIERSGELNKKYPDKWIVVYKKRVVGIGDNAEEAEIVARKKVGNKTAVVEMFVEGGPYVY